MPDRSHDTPEPPRGAPPPWLADLRVQVDDIIAAGLDATAAPGLRMLGRRAAREQIRAAGDKCRAIFALAGEGA